jgi:hypothetical protein
MERIITGEAKAKDACLTMRVIVTGEEKGQRWIAVF